MNSKALFSNIEFWKKFGHFLVIGLSTLLLVGIGQQVSLSNINVFAQTCDPTKQACPPPPPPPPQCPAPREYPQCGAVCSNGSWEERHTVLVRQNYDNQCNVWYGPCDDLGQIPGQCGNPVTPPPPPPPPPSPPPPPPQEAPVCDVNQLNMSVSPNPANVGNNVTFSLSGSQGSTWVGDSWSGGVNCSGDFWGSKTCTAQSPGGTFSWTHSWRNCTANNCDIVSALCSKTTNFTINQVQPPPPPPPSPPPPSPPPPSPPPPSPPPPSPPPPSPPPPSPIPSPPAGGVACPAGTQKVIKDNIIICVQAIATATATGGAGGSSTNTINITNNITNNPGTVAIVREVLSGNVGIGTTIRNGQVLGVQQLPKTGLPLLAWVAAAFLPAGLRLRSLGKVKEDIGSHPHFLWEDRVFKQRS